MKKTYITALVSLVAAAMLLICTAAFADTNKTEQPAITTEESIVSSEPAIQILVKEDDVVVRNLKDSEVFFSDTYLTLHGTEYSFCFSEDVYSFTYQLTAIENDGSVYTEANYDNIYRSNTHMCRSINHAVNYLTVVAYDKDGQRVEQATFVLVNQR